MKRSLLIVCILILIILVDGCTNLNSSTTKNKSNIINDTIPADKYIAVYEEYTNTSSLIGNTTYIPLSPMPIPYPTLPFDYNNSTGNVLNMLSNTYIINDSFKILYGNMEHYYSPWAYGDEGTFLCGVYELPFTVEDGFTISKVAGNGTIYAAYNNESILLNPGDNWTSPIITGTGMGRYYTDYANNTFYSWPISYNTSFTITNMGIYNKSLLNRSYTNT